MSRWRPPAARSTAIITRPGFEALKSELDDLWHTQRPEVVRALAAAAAEGDRSENAEYTYRKKQLAGIDRRARYLARRIPSLQVVDSRPDNHDAVFFGAELTLENTSSGKQTHYRIVGPDETCARRGWISIDSPLARAALNKRVEDTFAVQLPDGQVEMTVLDIRYPD